MEMEDKVAVYENGKILAIVEINRNLDGDAGNSGFDGIHLGLTRLNDGRYVLISSSQWEGDEQSAEVITSDKAFDYICQTGNYYLLNDPKFADLKPMLEELESKEMK